MVFVVFEKLSPDKEYFFYYLKKLETYMEQAWTNWFTDEFKYGIN